MVSISTPVAEWLVGIVADPEDKCEILGDLLGDDLTMAEFAPVNMDDDTLAEVLEEMDLDDNELAHMQAALSALRPQLDRELELGLWLQMCSVHGRNLDSVRIPLGMVVLV